MSEIVIRHAEPKDYDAIRQIHAQPEVYHNTLQVPHPSLEMWQMRLGDQPGIKQLVACIDDIVVGHLTIDVAQRPRRSHVADFGICVGAQWHNRGVASALMRTMIDMCDNWLRVERIELTVFADNAPAIAVYKKYGFEIEGTGIQTLFRCPGVQAILDGFHQVQKGSNLVKKVKDKSVNSLDSKLNRSARVRIIYTYTR